MLLPYPSLFAPAIAALLMAGASGSFALPVTEPLSLTNSFVPSITFTETHVDSVVKTVDPLDSTNVSFDVAASRVTTATIIANITGVDLASIDETTSFALNLGACQISFTLGEIQTYMKGQTTAFYCWNGWDSKKKPLGTGGVHLTWTASKLTVTVTMGNEISRPSPIGTDPFVGAGTTMGTFPIKDTLTADIAFGSVSTSVARPVQFTGTYRVNHVIKGPVDSPLYEFDLYTVNETGSADYTRPSVALTAPRQGALIGDSVDVTGTAADAKGLSGLEWSSDLSPDWTATDQFSFSSTPADGLWGPTTAVWTVSLTNLPHGTRNVYVRSVDDSGNTSLPLTITLVRPLPVVLNGRWDALLLPEAVNGMQGALNFTFAANGNYSGSLVTENGTFPISGSLKSDETLATSVKRTVALGSVELAGAIASFTPAGESVASIVGSLRVGGTTVATFSAVRSPWTTTKLAAANLAGLFHVKIAAASAPVGENYAIVTTARTGAATAAFSMADGSVVTWSGFMGAAGQLPAFALMYAGKGSVSSPMTINGGARSVDATTVTWNRPAAVADKQFLAGFHYAGLAASGAAYLAPVPITARVMGLGATPPNATATWSGDNVPSHTLPFTVNVGNTTAIVSPVDALKLTVTASSGLWAGSFKIPGTAILSTCKLLIVGNEAVGQWLAPAPVGSLQKRYGVIHVQ